MSDILLFGALPYVVIVLFFVLSIIRYRKSGFTVSTLSSQFLESKKLFWGSVPFHIGIILLFFGHLIGFLFPNSVIAFNRVPIRLLILEITAFVAGLLFLVGLLILIIRRLETKRLWAVTSKMDVVLYGVLLFQVLTGLYIAFFLRWGSAWYVEVITPYLRSIFTFDPKVELIISLPWMVKLHILGSMVLVALFPFTRLMHVLVVPIPFLWWKTQTVIWNRHNHAKDLES